MASYVDPLVVGRVIGEVVDLFVPTMSMSVSYGTKHVNNGCDVKPSMAINPPTVQIAGRRADLYTLVSMVLCIYSLSCFSMHYLVLHHGGPQFFFVPYICFR